tara:strand:- start:581 stop:1183 length:603 start_codon:yes stop_codon:yes gene_type:complete
VAKLDKALGALLDLLGKRPAREDIGAFKDIPANDQVNLSKVEELHKDLNFETQSARQQGMIDMNTELDASIFRAVPELDDYYSDLPNIFRFDNPNSPRTARDERISFIDSREKIDKIRQYGFPIERDPDFKGDPGPDNVFYRTWLRNKNMKFEDVFDYDPDKISINELLKKQAQYEFLKSYNLSPEDIRDILNVKLDKDK